MRLWVPAFAGTQGNGEEHGLCEARRDGARCLAALPRLHDLRRADARLPRMDARRGEEPPDHSPGDRGGHQFLRHRQRLFGRQLGGNHRPRAQRIFPPRRGRHRHQGVQQDARRPQRERPLAQGDHARDRRQPAPPRHRLYRSLPDPPPRSRHADRGDARGASRRRQGGQGALYRRVIDVCLAVRDDAPRRRDERLDAFRLDAEFREPALPRGGARDAAALRGGRHRRDPVESARARQAHPPLGRDDQALRDRSHDRHGLHQA